MVVFNELKIIKNKLIIDVSIPRISYYTNVYLDQIIIDNQDTFNQNSGLPSSNPIFTYTITPVIPQLNGVCKDYRLEIECGSLDAPNIKADDMLFVFITTTGTVESDAPCGFDETTSMHVVTDMKPFYLQAMSYMKELTNKYCDFPKNFVDYILKFKMLELSIKTGNYSVAIDFFNKYIKNSASIRQKGGCGCGRK